MSVTDRPPATVCVGVIADPHGKTSQVSDRVCAQLPGLLQERLPSVGTWDVRQRAELLPGGRIGDHSSILDFAARRRREEDWDVALLLTDAPLREGHEPLVADVAVRERVAIISLPAFGVMRVGRDVTRLAVGLVLKLLRPSDADTKAALPTHGVIGSPFRVVREDDVAVQVRASRGGWRLLTGIVWNNRPWRLVAGLRAAMVGALAFSLFWLLSPTIWHLSAALAPWRLALIAGAAISSMVVWLILYHHLWMRGARDDPAWREEMRLLNASTVLTLLVGVSCAYLALFAINAVAALGIIAAPVLADQLQRPASLADYLSLTWLAASCATFAGALGSGLDDERKVREAAYSRRLLARREKFQQASDDDDT